MFQVSSEPSTWVVAAFIVGAVLRVALPYLHRWVESKEQFDLRYLIGQLLGVFVGLIPVVFVDSFVDGLATMSWVAAVSYGWASADLGREAQKWVKLISAN